MKDTIRGLLCDDCRLVWVGGYTAHELGLDKDSATFSDNSTSCAEYLGDIECADESVNGGYFTCWICDTAGISGYPFSANVVAG